MLAFGVSQIILSALLIGLYAWWGFAEWEASLVLGLGFAQSSTVVVVQLLKERNELHSAWGSKALRSSWLKTSLSCRCYWSFHSWPSGRAPVVVRVPYGSDRAAIVARFRSVFGTSGRERR